MWIKIRRYSHTYTYPYLGGLCSLAQTLYTFENYTGGLKWQLLVLNQKGLHTFYGSFWAFLVPIGFTSKRLVGILYLLTGGIFGIGWIIDLFTLGGQVDTYNIIHGSMGSPNQSQNVVVNVTTPTMTPQVATNQTSAPQIALSEQVKISAEKAILSLADKTPILTLRQIMTNANLEMDEAETAIKKLIVKGIAKEEVDSSGKSTYTFE